MTFKIFQSASDQIYGSDILMDNHSQLLQFVVNDHDYCSLPQLPKDTSRLNSTQHNDIPLETPTLKEACIYVEVLQSTPTAQPVDSNNNNTESQTKIIPMQSILQTPSRKLHKYKLPQQKKAVTFLLSKATSPKKRTQHPEKSKTQLKNSNRGKLKKSPIPKRQAGLCNVKNEQLEQADTSVTLSALERVYREAYAFVTDPNRDKVQTESKILETQLRVRSLCPAQSDAQQRKYRANPLRPKLSNEDIARIAELYPPDNYEPPSDELRDLRCMRGYQAQQLPSLSPDVSTLRCISNHSAHLTSGESQRCVYETSGDYYGAERVNYLPVPSVWTPRHALMNTAPCISSPGIFQNNSTGVGTDDVGTDDVDSTDTDEENAIY